MNGLFSIFLSIMVGIFSIVSSNLVKHRETEIQTFFDQRTEMVKNRDLTGFLRSISQTTDSFYYYEQLRWLQDAIDSINLPSYQVKVKKITKEQGFYIAEVVQEYQKQQQKHHITSRFALQKTPSGWLAKEYFVNLKQEGSIKVYYAHPKLQDKAVFALHCAKEAIAFLGENFGWKPQQVIVKLYDQPETFRTSVKLSLPHWAAGWHEHKEAIKLIGSYDLSFLRDAITHELTHQMVSDLTHDNASYWLQEGAAMTYESLLLPNRQSSELPKELRYSLKQLGELDLESLKDQEALRYYLSSKDLFQFLLGKYGQEKMKIVFQELRKYPEQDGDSRSKRVKNHQLTLEAFRNVYGLDEKEINKQYLLH